MKKLLYGVYTFSIAAGLVLATPVIQGPLFGADSTPGKIEQNKAGKQNLSTQTPVKTMTQQPPKTQGTVVGTNTDTVKNKAKGGKKKETRIDEDPVGTKR